MTIRVLVADPNSKFRQSVRSVLAGESDLELVGEASRANEAALLGSRFPTHVAVTEIGINGCKGLDLARRLTHDCPGVRVVVVSIYPNKHLVDAAFSAGAAGYVAKECMQDDLLSAIQAVSQGHTYLSPCLNGRS